MKVTLKTSSGQPNAFNADTLEEVMANVGPRWPITIDGIDGHLMHNGDVQFVATPITANELWRIHHAALGGVSAATGAKLPEWLENVEFSAVKLAHWAMALVMARRAGLGDPLPPSGLKHDDEVLVLRRLAAANLLPEPVPAAEKAIADIGDLVVKVLSLPANGSRSATEARELDERIADCRMFVRMAYGKHTDPASRLVLDALAKILGIHVVEDAPSSAGAINIEDVAKNIKLLSDAAEAASDSVEGFNLDHAKRVAAEKLFARITEFAPTSTSWPISGGIECHATSKDSDLGFLAHAFNAVCQGLAATAPEPIFATLESFAEPLRASSFLDDLMALSKEQLAHICALRGLRVVPIELASCGSASVHADSAPASTIKDPDQP